MLPFWKKKKKKVMIKCKFTFPGADELSLQSKVSEKKSMPGTVGKRTGESKMNEMRKTSEVLLESPASLGAQARCLRERDAERIVHGLEEAVLFWGGWF